MFKIIENGRTDNKEISIVTTRETRGDPDDPDPLFDRSERISINYEVVSCALRY